VLLVFNDVGMTLKLGKDDPEGQDH